MCGIVAVLLADQGQPASELIYNALCMLQHRASCKAKNITCFGRAQPNICTATIKHCNHS